MNKELTDEELLYASEEDWAFFYNCIDGLPTREGVNGNYWDKNGKEIPWGSGPHIIKYFKRVIDIVNPTGILEVGLCLGAGASMWLHLSNSDVVSIDNSDREETIQAGETLLKKFSKRFRYSITSNPADVLNGVPFDLCWLDGAHDELSIEKDIELCKFLKIPYILFDDWYPRYGETQQAVAKFPELELVEDMNNLRLYKWKS